MATWENYSITPSENNGPPPIGAPEGMAPSAVNDVLREMQAAIRNLAERVSNGTLPGATGLIPADRLNALPAGMVMASASPHIPAGWLECGGQEVLIATYPSLYNAIGNIYGVANNAGHFTLPDLRARIIGGRDTLGGNLPSNRITVFNSQHLGAWSGDQWPQVHTHEAWTGSAGSHSHTGVTDVHPGHFHDITVHAGGAHWHDVPMGSWNGDNRGSYFTGATGTMLKPIGTTTSGAHNHAASASAGGIHGHQIGTYGVADHTHTVAVAYTGQGNSQNLQPMIIMNYWIKT